MDIGQLISVIALCALPVIFAITVHEAAHGLVAKRLGDDTAWLQGRVTLNPTKHIDPVGTLLLPLLLYFATSGAFVFGYARPVPVRFGNLRRPKQDMMWVALAGPVANIVQAFMWGILLALLSAMGVQEAFFIKMCQVGINVNLVMFAFNLFPLPPLDGGRILVGLLPYPQARLVAQLEPFGFFIVMALVYTRVVNDLWMLPVMRLASAVLDMLWWPFSWLLH